MKGVASSLFHKLQMRNLALHLVHLDRIFVLITILAFFWGGAVHEDVEQAC